MPLFPGRKSKIFLAILLLNGVFLFSLNAKTAQAYHATSSYNKLFNDTLTSQNWNDLFSDFVNTWLPVSMNGPLGIATSSPASGLEVNGIIRGSSLFSSGNVGFGTSSPVARLEVVPTSGYAILAGNYKIGNVALPTADADAATKGYVDSFVASATSSFSNLWGGSVVGNIWNLNSGNVGIGTTTPIGNLHVYDATGGWAKLIIENSASQQLVAAELQLKSRNSARGGVVTNYDPVSDKAWGAGVPYYTSYDSFQIGFVNNASTLTFKQTETMRASNSLLTIRSNGNVGIGTSTPIRKLNLEFSAGGHDGLLIRGVGTGSYPELTIDRGYNYRTSVARFSTAGTLDWAMGTLYNSGSGNSSFSINNTENLSGSIFNILSTGNIGIGTTTPVAKLEIVPTSGYAILAGNYKIGNVALPTADADAATKGYVDSTVASATSSLSNLWGGTIGGSIWNLNSGNVGIGTTSPVAKLNVYSSIGGASSGILVKADGNYASMDYKVTSSGTGLQTGLYQSGESFFYNSDGGMTFYTDPTLGGVGATARMSILGSGNVGIGTTSPSALLDVQGQVRLGKSGSGGGITLARPFDGTYQGYVGYTGATNDFIISNAGGGSTLQFRTGSNTERMRIDSAGNVGIGTTTPVAKLEIVPTSGYAILAGNYKIGNVALPTVDADVATKGYVDSTVASATSSLSNLWGGTIGGNIWNLNSGNIGIGTSSPSNKLDVEGVISSGYSFGLGEIRSYQSPGYYVSLKTGAGKSGIYRNNADFFLYYDTGNGSINMDATYAGASDIFKIGGTERMRIANSGNVGIGTSTPVAKLEIVPTSGYAILAGNYKIGNVALPTVDADVATKGYVDSIVVSYVASTTAGIKGTAYYVGITPTAYTGDNNGTAGYVAAENACAAAFASSSVCTPDNILSSIAAGITLPSEDVWIFAGPPGYTAAANDCEGRSVATTAAYGTYWQIAMTGRPQGRGLLMRCNNSLRLACCR